MFAISHPEVALKAMDEWNTEHHSASGLWQRVLDLRGEDPEALNALGDIYAGQGNWRDLVDVLEREAAIAEEDAFRVQVYSDLARVWYEKLERERNAIENWERVLDIDPGNTYALFSIAEIQRAGGQSRERADTLHRIIDVGLDRDGAPEIVVANVAETFLTLLHHQLAQRHTPTILQRQAVLQQLTYILEAPVGPLHPHFQLFTGIAHLRDHQAVNQQLHGAVDLERVELDAIDGILVQGNDEFTAPLAGVVVDILNTRDTLQDLALPAGDQGGRHRAASANASSADRGLPRAMRQQPRPLSDSERR